MANKVRGDSATPLSGDNFIYPFTDQSSGEFPLQNRQFRPSNLAVTHRMSGFLG
jgi:hypothetical protein